MQTPEDQIADYFKLFASPPPDQVRRFIDQGRRSFFARGTPLVELGETEHKLFFIHSGIVRYRVVVPSTGEDVTKDFSFAPIFALSFGSVVQDRPARVGVAAVDDCVATFWPFKLFTSLFDTDAEWQKFGRKAAEWLYIRKEDRELEFLTQTAARRYASIATRFPEEIARVPQHLLASYLGIAPESLSRLKMRLARKERAGGARRKAGEDEED